MKDIQNKKLDKLDKVKSPHLKEGDSLNQKTLKTVEIAEIEKNQKSKTKKLDSSSLSKLLKSTIHGRARRKLRFSSNTKIKKYGYLMK